MAVVLVFAGAPPLDTPMAEVVVVVAVAAVEDLWACLWAWLFLCLPSTSSRSIRCCRMRLYRRSLLVATAVGGVGGGTPVGCGATAGTDVPAAG